MEIKHRLRRFASNAKREKKELKACRNKNNEHSCHSTASQVLLGPLGGAVVNDASDLLPFSFLNVCVCVCARVCVSHMFVSKTKSLTVG